jgi:WD40 repeat protein
MENMVKRAILIALSLAAFAAGSRAQETLYVATGSKGAPGVLYTVDPNTAAFSAVAPILVGGSSIGLTGLAFNPLNDVLYGVTGLESPNFPRNLVSINPATGAANIIGAILDPGFGSSLGLTDLSFRSDGTLFGISPNEMYTINLSNAALTTIGPTGENAPGGGLAFSPSGILFSAGKATGTLDTLNTSTGARTMGPTLTNSPHAGSLGAMTALAFNSAGTLFGSDSDRAQNGATTVSVDLVTINTATGVVANLGQLPNDIDAIAFGPAVPEPSSLSLIAVGAGLVGYLRHRRSR